MFLKQFLSQKGFSPATLAQRFVVKPPPTRRSCSIAGVTATAGERAGCGVKKPQTIKPNAIS